MKKLIGLGLLAFIICAAFLTAGCYSWPVTESAGINGINVEHSAAFGTARVPAKDFESLGLVFTEFQLVTSKSGGGYYSTPDTAEGEVFIYQALLKEAHKLGADAIINVIIDKVTKSEERGQNTVTEYTWYGTALAIKYTDSVIIPEDMIYAIPGSNPPENSNTPSRGLFGR